ncbi:MAG: ROK family protein [Bacteroidales bacterium]|nr:ROK family protein [Candidatus Colimorpha onthohippi]
MYSIGIDIGGTNTDIGLVNENGTILERCNLKTGSFTDFECYVQAVASEIKTMIGRNNLSLSDMEGIGIGAPNGNYYSGCIENAMNLTMRGVLNARKEFAKYFDCPVVLSNDANAAAYGELIYGGAKGMKNIIMFTMGTGVGSGIIVDGRLLLGSTGSAGELGHAIAVPGGRTCSCGLHGCLEAYASIRGILQTYREIRAEHDALHANDPVKEGWIDPSISINEISCRNLGNAANQGDPLALKTFAMTARYMGIAMANAVAFSSPEAIFLMGGPAQVGDPLLIPLRQAFKENLLYSFDNTCSIQMSQLNANDVAILGAAALIKMK